MSATFLYTLLLGIIYLVKINVKAIQARRRQDSHVRGKKQLASSIQREVKPQVVIEFREENKVLREAVIELT